MDQIISKVRIEEDQCCYLFEPGNTEELAGKIIHAYTERESLNRLGKNGRVVAEKDILGKKPQSMFWKS